MSKIFYNCIKAAFKVGIMASVVNILWFIAAKIILLIDYPSVKWYFVLVATMLPILLAGVVYYLLYSATSRHHRILFIIGCIAVIILTLFGGPLSPVLPDGSPSTRDFQVLTIPMHCVAGFMAAFMIPAWNHLNDGPGEGAPEGAAVS
jgi:hypothetical protein